MFSKPATYYSLTSYVPSSSLKFIPKIKPWNFFKPLPRLDSLSFKNLIPKIKWITPQSSLSLNRNCLFHFHPHLRRGFSQPLPSITDPTRSAFVSSENPENHLYSFPSVTVSLENLRHFLTTDSPTRRRKGGRDASILLGLLEEFIPINSLFLRVYSKDHYGKHAGTCAVELVAEMSC